MMDPRARILSDFTRRTLEALASGSRDGVSHWDLYRVMFPTGRFNTDRDHGSSKGGPSRVECAVNWHMGKLGNLVRRVCRPGGFYGDWTITEAGRDALKNAI